MSPDTADFANATEALAAGRALLAEKRTVEALAPLIRATELDAYNAEAFRVLGEALIAADWQEQAVKALIRSVELNDRVAETFESLAAVYTRLKQHEEAGVCLRRAADLLKEDLAKAQTEKPSSAVPLVIEDDAVVFDFVWKGLAGHCWLEGPAQFEPLYAVIAVHGAEPPAPEIPDAELIATQPVGNGFIAPYLDAANAARFNLFPAETRIVRLYRLSGTTKRS